MEFEEFESHRFCRIKWIKIIAKHRETGSHCIVTCEINKMAQKVKSVEKRGYKIENILEL